MSFVGEFERGCVKKMREPSSLFNEENSADLKNLREGVTLLRRFFDAQKMYAALSGVMHAAPFRRMQVPRGKFMSVAITNCGDWGWVSDTSGYRYSKIDPVSGRPWPLMPTLLSTTASNAAKHAGYVNFIPDACLINCYQPGARMGLHQDRDEQDFLQPIVSLSIGLPAIFLIGGDARTGPTQKIELCDGDALVFGGAARKMFHGVMPLAAGQHPLTGQARINLTFRRAR